MIITLKKNLKNRNNKDRGLNKYHVIGRDERIVDSNKLYIISLQSNSSNQSSDSSETYTFKYKYR